MRKSLPGMRKSLPEIRAKRMLLALALTLSASASAFAQSGGLERRDGDMFVGPVKTVIVEVTLFARADGTFAESPRLPSASFSYSEDGKRRENKYYALDGTLRSQSVFVYDDAGLAVEQTFYDSRDDVISKLVLKPDEGEVLNYDGAGNLRQRVVTVTGEDGSKEVRTYDGSGALEGKSVTTRGESGVTTKTYDGSGALRREYTAGRGERGAAVSQIQSYNTEGAPLGRVDMKAGADSTEFESVQTGPTGTRKVRMRETRERDERGNPLKSMRYAWNDSKGGFLPYEATYYTVTYYR